MLRRIETPEAVTYDLEIRKAEHLVNIRTSPPDLDTAAGDAAAEADSLIRTRGSKDPHAPEIFARMGKERFFSFLPILNDVFDAGSVLLETLGVDWKSSPVDATNKIGKEFVIPVESGGETVTVDVGGSEVRFTLLAFAATCTRLALCEYARQERERF